MNKVQAKLEERVSFEVSPVSQDLQNLIMNSLVFQPRAYLEERALLLRRYPPAFNISLGDSHNRNIFSSRLARVSKLNGNRFWTVIYVPTIPKKDLSLNPEVSFRATPAYQSLSHGLWRILPNMEETPEGIWYDKGHGETSVTLPLAVQRAMSQ